MRAEALHAQREYDDSELAGVNPNSLHSLGRKAAARLEVARREIARSFGARVRPSEIILTNGGTEANQLALLGLAEGARQRDRKRNRVIVSAIEHDSILDNLPLLRAAGFTVDLVQPCRAGYIETAALNDLLGDDVALVSIMQPTTRPVWCSPSASWPRPRIPWAPCSTPMPSRATCIFRSMSPSWASMP